MLTFVGGADLCLAIAGKHAAFVVVGTDLSAGDASVIHLMAPDIRRFLHSVLKAIHSLLLSQIDMIFNCRVLASCVHTEVLLALHAGDGHTRNSRVYVAMAQRIGRLTPLALHFLEGIIVAVVGVGVSSVVQASQINILGGVIL